MKFSSVPSPSVSSKYEFIDSNRIIELLGDRGFSVKSITRGKRGKVASFGSHIVTMYNPDLPKIEGEGEFTITFSNSFDGSTKFSLGVGFYRLVCSNGLMLGSGLLQYKTKHIGVNSNSIYEMLDDAIEQIPMYIELINKAKETKIEPLSGHSAFFSDAIDLFRSRFNIKESVVKTFGLFARRRDEDESSDLWTMLNVLQENLLRSSNIEYVTIKDGISKDVLLKRSRGVEGSPKMVNLVNKGIADLLVKYAA